MLVVTMAGWVFVVAASSSASASTQSRGRLKSRAGSASSKPARAARAVDAVDRGKAAAKAGSRVVFSCGGDGTLNEVGNGLVGTEATLAVIRGGTGNVFGKEVGVAKDPERALRVLIEGEERRFDLGVAAPPAGPSRAPSTGSGQNSGGTSGRGGRYFILMAGVGIDGSVVRRVPERPKRLLGTTSYVLWGAAEALRFRSRRA